jgi:Tfp pilus assembly protein PilX
MVLVVLVMLVVLTLLGTGAYARVGGGGRGG